MNKPSNKDLHEMTSEELGQLFPIFLVEHNDTWKDLYDAEKQLILNSFPDRATIQTDHIGSTAIPGIKAKPTIDILLQVDKSIPDKNIIDTIRNLGYEYIRKEENPPPHMLFVKGYTKHGFEGQAFHIHVRYLAKWHEIVFRDYLINHPETAKEYENLKEDLAIEYEYDRDGYTEAKTGFITKVLGFAGG